MSKYTTQSAGHRGMGCTDHDVYQSLRDVQSLPVENTIESVRAAFKAGAAYIETDAVMSGDGVMFTIHNVVPKDHFFDEAHMPPQLLNQMNFADIQKYKTGRHGTGEITTFAEMMKVIAECDPKTLPWAINIEIKGVQGSGQNYETNEYLDNLAEIVRQSGVPVERVLFSSFSLQNILAMSHKLPQAQYGMLFAEKGDVKGIYADHRDDMRYQYLQFDQNSVDAVNAAWKDQAHPAAKLGYMHPEILTVTNNMIDCAAQKGFGINCWALFEKLDAGRIQIYKDTIAYAENRDVGFTVITDYIPELKQALLAA